MGDYLKKKVYCLTLICFFFINQSISFGNKLEHFPHIELKQGTTNRISIPSSESINITKIENYRMRGLGALYDTWTYEDAPAIVKSLSQDLDSRESDYMIKFYRWSSTSATYLDCYDNTKFNERLWYNKDLIDPCWFLIISDINSDSFHDIFVFEGSSQISIGLKT